MTGQSGARAASAARQLCACGHVSASSSETGIRFGVLVCFFLGGGWERQKKMCFKCRPRARQGVGASDVLVLASRRPDHPSEGRSWPESVSGLGGGG